MSVHSDVTTWCRGAVIAIFHPSPRFTDICTLSSSMRVIFAMSLFGPDGHGTVTQTMSPIFISILRPLVVLDAAKGRFSCTVFFKEEGSACISTLVSQVQCPLVFERPFARPGLGAADDKI